MVHSFHVRNTYGPIQTTWRRTGAAQPQRWRLDDSCLSVLSSGLVEPQRCRPTRAKAGRPELLGVHAKTSRSLDVELAHLLD